MTTFNEADCLATDPFAGDFGDPGDRTLFDKIVRAAKPHPSACHDCAGDIAKGERHRSRSDVADGDLMSFRWCAECCAAQAASWEDDGKAWEARIGIGMRKRGQLPPLTKGEMAWMYDATARPREEPQQ